jgi:integrase/recombinase XerD
MLQKLIQGKNPDDYIFTAQREDIKGHRLHETSIRNELKRRVEACGITKEVSPHTFRHSFITELMKQDISILKIANIVGHEKVQTTADYAKLLFEDLRNSIMRHPIISKTRNPYEILKHITETIRHFHLENDKRFFFELTEGNEGIRINLFIR